MRTLRSLFAAMLLAALCPVTKGQSPHRQLFLVDPYETNGYFLVDQEKFDALGLDRIEVHIHAAQLEGRDITTSRVLESVTISNSFYGKADLSKILDITPNERVYYEAAGYNAAGDPLVDIQALPTGWHEWPETCRRTCEARWYSWTLVAYDDPLSNDNVIEIQPGSIDGLAPRVYIRPGVNPNTGDGYWQEFQDQFDPTIHFGMSGTWSEIEDSDSDDIIEVNPVPSNARDYQGYALGNVSGPVRAVRKDKGPWVGLFAWTEPFDDPYICGSGQSALPMRYNADQNVIAALLNGGPSGPMPPLGCEVYLQSGGGLSWGEGYNCTNYNFYETPGGNLNLPNATFSAYGCITLTNVNGDGPYSPITGGSDHGIPGIFGLMVNEWTAYGKSTIMTVPFPSRSDPKLVPVPRQEISNGLYEFVIILEDGRLWSIFMEVDESIILTADFSSFVDINVYPVPVTDTYFSIDFDLATPMSISMSILNNLGIVKYSKELVFDLSGRNKHVVKMSEQWPSGVYHALFQFPDGSIQSRSFLVETP